MAKKYLDSDGLLYVWQKITNTFVKKDGSKVLSDNNYTTTEKNKLSGIEAGATKTTIDSALSTTSTNPVQNKVVNTALGNKVDKVSGKGLSTNDFTTELKNKYDATVETVAGLTATGGEPNKVDDVKVNGTSVVSNKIATITVPTNNNQLTNGAGYQTASQVESAITGKGYQTSAQVTSAINSAIADITGIDFQVVTSLPSTGKKGVIYLVSNSGSNPNSYDEYIYVNNKFEKIGTTDVDLSGYVKSSDLVAITNGEIDTIVAS